MDIKDLNKGQLILLAILLSFITSIATGITTVTLMQQGAASVTVPINRVVRQTVEKIQQVEGKTTVQTVVVKEEDLIVDAISKNHTAVFSVSKDGYDIDGNKIEIPVGRGFAVSTSGIVAVDAALVTGPDLYYLKNDSGKFRAEYQSADKAGFALLKIGDPVDVKSQVSYTVPDFADFSAMKAGQKVIILGDTISSFIYDGDKAIKISASRANSGALVLNLDGEVMGMALFNDAQPFASIDQINGVLNPSTPAQN